MSPIFFTDLVNITGGRLLQNPLELPVTHLLIDSRKPLVLQGAVFFAISGSRHNGHNYIQDLYTLGIRQFIVEAGNFKDLKLILQANILEVENSIVALQKITEFHRNQFHYPVVAITGSNGKTIVKEWLAQMLGPKMKVIKSPKSYNSQVGVPLSVWQLNENYEMAIVEAGISKPGEMDNLAKVIRPDYGIFANIGTAHDEGFKSKTQKIEEKAKLFDTCKTVICCRDHTDIYKSLVKKPFKLFTWGLHESSLVRISEIRKEGDTTNVMLLFQEEELCFNLLSSDPATFQNAMHCIAFLLYLGFDPVYIQQQLRSLQKVSMRLELKQGRNGIYLIDDSYNNDLAGLQIALDFLNQQNQKEKKTIILSDIPQAGISEKALYQNVADLIKSRNISRFIGIGGAISRYSHLFDTNSTFYLSTEDFLTQGNLEFNQELVLVKGARVFSFEKIINKLQKKIHGTVLEINLDAITHNLNFYKSRLHPQTKIMVMVKALAYGSGSFEVAHLLQYHQVDYLAVAYPDEAAALRENGITLPIMVMNPSEESFEKLVEYKIEPEIYNLRILTNFLKYLNSIKKEAGIHLKLDTGMHRLGFEEDDLAAAISLLRGNEYCTIKGIFSHLAGADESIHNEFSLKQIRTFERNSSYIEKELAITAIKHILNSAGIIRFPEYQYNMVRLGIGLYGFDSNREVQDELQHVSSLKSIISQIKEVKKGESVGYSRRSITKGNSKIATIAIGYADGYDRRFGNGTGWVSVNGKLAPIIGNVCMDMTMVDVTNVEAEEGDEVIIFGENPTISDLAASIGTIPYEILTNVSERVKRVFYTE